MSKRHALKVETGNVLWRVYSLLGNNFVKKSARSIYASTIGRLFSMWSAPRPFLCNVAVNTLKTIRDKRMWCFLHGPCKLVIKRDKLRPFEMLACQDMSLGAEELNRADNNSKKDFLCDSKWLWDCYKSVAGIRLLKTKNRSACVTMNGKVCRSAYALYYL
jgi:hypothetical protein